MKLFERLFTKNLTRIPLLWVDFNYNKYKSDGKKGSCITRLHPNLSEDEHIKNTLNDLIDYIRDNYNLKDL